MTKLWKNGQFAEDGFVLLEDAADIPPGRAIAVSLMRWREHGAALRALATPIAVLADPAAELVPASDHLNAIAAIFIPFAKFADGRGYSLARRLRDEFGYRGEIRATGDVLLDQVPLMLRCGFDAFAITNAPTLAALAAGHLPAIPEVYQAAARGRPRTTATF
jgi:uncharacterized protein (DUF934 family)